MPLRDRGRVQLGACTAEAAGVRRVGPIPGFQHLCPREVGSGRPPRICPLFCLAATSTVRGRAVWNCTLAAESRCPGEQLVSNRGGVSG